VYKVVRLDWVMGGISVCCQMVEASSTGWVIKSAVGAGEQCRMLECKGGGLKMFVTHAVFVCIGDEKRSRTFTKGGPGRANTHATPQRLIGKQTANACVVVNGL